MHYSDLDTDYGVCSNFQHFLWLISNRHDVAKFQKYRTAQKNSSVKIAADAMNLHVGSRKSGEYVANSARRIARVTGASCAPRYHAYR